MDFWSEENMNSISLFLKELNVIRADCERRAKRKMAL